MNSSFVLVELVISIFINSFANLSDIELQYFQIFSMIKWSKAKTKSYFRFWRKSSNRRRHWISISDLKYSHWKYKKSKSKIAFVFILSAFIVNFVVSFCSEYRDSKDEEKIKTIKKKQRGILLKVTKSILELDKWVCHVHSYYIFLIETKRK